MVRKLPGFIVAVSIFLTFIQAFPACAEEQPPRQWPSSHLTLKNIHDYLLKNRWNLDPIEGIWNYSERQIWQRKESETESISLENVYQIAIVRQDLQSSDSFQAVIVSSKFDDWNFPGRIKANFTHSGQEGVYTARWFGGDYHVFTSLFVLDQDKRQLTGAFQLHGDKGRIVSRVTIRKTFPANHIRISELH
ncbi:MAG: hypothetical protein C0616_11915 [Desulfuromonas sp.]|nr:MAG: hypothetical protein C0616_11915 [Desulfuromonas sp.]